MNNYNAIPQELRALPQWVVYRLPDKIPLRINGEKASTSDSLTWATFGEVKEANGFDGIGFVFTENDPYCGIDFDHCINYGKFAEDKKKWIKWFNSYSEVSPSGRGIHVIIKAKLPAEGSKKGGYECYDRRRYFTFTGRHLKGIPPEVKWRQEELKKFYVEVFGLKPEVKPAPIVAPLISDEEIIKRAMAADNGDKFTALWKGDTKGYPSPSEADLALCGHLRFWTGRNTAQMDRLFRQSGLYRDKWDRNAGAGKTYGQKTIEKALEGGEVYKIKKEEAKLPSPAEEGFRLGSHLPTDLGNAERLVSRQKEVIRFCHPWNKWLVWDGKRWAVDAEALVFQYATNTVRGMYSEAAKIDEKATRRKLGEYAMKCEARTKLDAMVSIASKLEEIPILPKDLDTNTWLLNCENGTIDLRTGELQEHNKGGFITKLAPVKFDKSAKCPKWLALLNRATKGDKNMEGFLQRVAGYCLTGRVSEQKLFFIYGPSMTSKSTFLKVLQGILGDYAVKATSELLLTKPIGAHTTDITDLRGKRLAITVEIQEGRRMAESLVKELTGGDTITGRRMRQDNIEWEPTHKIMLAANHKPIVHETTTAFWRRIDIIPFCSIIPESERIKDYYEILLKEERDGIILWALGGCSQWQKEGLKEPPRVLSATKEYRDEMDILGGFIDDCCIIGQREETPNKKLREGYDQWCEDNGEKSISAKAFSQRLEEKGFIRIKKMTLPGQPRGWKGIGLKSKITPVDNLGARQ